MSEIKFDIDDRSIESLRASLYLDTGDLLSQMDMVDIINHVCEFEDEDVLLKRIGKEKCIEYFGLSEAQ